MRFGNRDDGRATTRSGRTGASPGNVRGLVTLGSVAGAAAFVWAAQLFDLDSGGEFWSAMAVLAAAGFVLGIAQLVGGWTKWGWPTISWRVFLIAFVPTLVLGTWLLLARQPENGWAQGTFDNWTGDVGLGSLADDLGAFLAVVPVVIGLVLAFSFDTTGPRRQIIDDDYRARESQETVAAELRRAPAAQPAGPAAAGEAEPVAEKAEPVAVVEAEPGEPAE